MIVVLYEESAQTYTCQISTVKRGQYSIHTVLHVGPDVDILRGYVGDFTQEISYF